MAIPLSAFIAIPGGRGDLTPIRQLADFPLSVNREGVEGVR